MLTPPSGGRVLFCGLNPSSAAFVLSESLRRDPKSYLVLMPTPLEAEDFARGSRVFLAGRRGHRRGTPLSRVRNQAVFRGISGGGTGLFTAVGPQRPDVRPPAPGGGGFGFRGHAAFHGPNGRCPGPPNTWNPGKTWTGTSCWPIWSAPVTFPPASFNPMVIFSVRGGILDVYPPGADRPVRAEFFGDDVESLRTFRTLDQRSVDEIHEQMLLPASEIYFRPRHG